MSPENIAINDYMYDLPNDRIAKFPLEQRDHSKLLIYKETIIQEDTYKNLDAHLPEGTLVIFNNTKVVAARLFFKKATGSNIELFCLEPADEHSDVTNAMQQQHSVQWKCLVGGAKKWKQETLKRQLEIGDKIVVLEAYKTAQAAGYYIITFKWNESFSFAEILQAAGEIPLPPYLNRKTEAADVQRYQTIYAAHNGSVAAPTAGLHFTQDLLQRLAAKNITRRYVTLHVGAGTFKPVKAATMQAHDMHAEFFEISIDTISALLHHTEKIVAVGTTSLRTIESLYWLGVKVLCGHKPDYLLQWDCYKLPAGYSKEEAFSALINYMQRSIMQTLSAKTQIIIAPGYTLRVAQGIITNFHQPASTLLLLVAAIVGNDWRKIYDFALANDYRFLSYGDGSLLWKV